ncbi:Hydroxyquinol 1,2-dioxygenase (plasmid) [Cupriavidus necator]|uniref:Hydroxyquinol 1,2-dioxygenase n=1 Tax=Cupriavidus oxalaticus TaxID=96344 RepID=A0A5P3VWA1_9BURK|nr:hydroxyquinol 1,2-dioxygenase [Cupriavidus oxalaticus]QEZ48979.1 hydroxyquinol 1,2-dioxygenase [Cupriavidus oxalaticus]
MKSIKKVILASVVLATLGATSGAAIAVRQVDPFHDGAHVADTRNPFTDGARSVTDPRDPFTDGGHGSVAPRDPFTDGARGTTGRVEAGLQAAGVRKPDPFTDGSHGLAGSGAKAT